MLCLNNYFIKRCCSFALFVVEVEAKYLAKKLSFLFAQNLG